MPVETILKAVLFIGLLLICIGFYYYKFDTRKEGFQNTWNPSMCNSNDSTISLDNKCNSECGNIPALTPESLPTDLGPETDDEQIAYDVYEVNNLDNPPLTEPLPKIPTPNTKYQSAASLSLFDIGPGMPIPWDYDNLYQNPSDVLWGFIHPEASQQIFSKVESQFICGDITNMYQDPNNGKFRYQSTYFNTVLYNPTEAFLCQYAEFFIDFYTEEVFESIIDRTMRDPIKEADFINKTKRAEFAKKNTELIEKKKLDVKRELTRAELKGIKNQATAHVADLVQEGKFLKMWEKQKLLDNFERSVTYAESYRFNGGVKGVFKKFLGLPILRGKTEAEIANIMQQFNDSRQSTAASRSARVKAFYQAVGLGAEKGSEGTVRKLLRSMRPGKLISALDKMKNMIQKSGNTIRVLTARLLSKLPFSKAAQAIARLAAKIAQKIGIAIGRVVAIDLYITLTVPPPWGELIVFFLTAISLAMITVIPAIFNTFINIDEAVCPVVNGNKTWNLQESVEQSSSFGAIGWNILTNIPGWGDFAYAFMPYFCFDSSLGAHLKLNLYEPIFYSDPTTSLYSVPNKPKFGSGSDSIDDRLKNPYNYHDCPAPVSTKDPPQGVKAPDDTVTCGYKSNINSRVWVDYSNEYMLDKMAQFYFDSSRKFMETTYDGMVQYEYISKFYGIISTAELICDVQCEITVVKFNIKTGIKICEYILPNDGSNGITHHDRRFYFYKDLGRGKTPQERIGIGASGRMADNYVKFVVTACTHVDGTAPDSVVVSQDGMQTMNPVIGLGQPGSQFYPPVPTNGIDLTKNIMNSIPDDPSCTIVRTNFMKYGGNSTSTINTGYENTQTPTNIKIVAGNKQNSSLVEWINGYEGFDGNIYDSTLFITDENGQTVQGKSAKYSEFHQYGCKTYDNNCNINDRNNRAQVVVQVISGYLPYRWGLKGGLVATTAGATGLTTVLQCMFSDAAKLEGVFSLNGNNILSVPYGNSTKGYIVDLGPEPEFAPGYTPRIKYCKNQELELYDCVNRHAVRSFVNVYNNQFQNRQIKKINNITPRRVTKGEFAMNGQFKLSDKHLINSQNNKPMCVYDIEYVQFNSITFNEIPNTTATQKVAIQLTQDIENKTCIYKWDKTGRSSLLVNDSIPRLEPFSKDMEEPSIPAPGGRCAEIMSSLQTQFNTLPENINANQISGISNPHTITNKVTKLNECIFDVQFQKYDSAKTNFKTDTYTPPQVWVNQGGLVRVRMILERGNSTLAHVIIPANDIPNFKPPGCTNNSFSCEDPKLKDNLILNFNQAHTSYPKMTNITSGYPVMNQKSSLLQCIYSGTFDNVYNPITDNADNGVTRNITMNLQAAGNPFFSYRYLRFTVITGSSLISGFKLQIYNTDISWNQTYTVNDSNTPSWPINSPIIFDYKAPIVFTSYSWMMGTGSDPTGWTLAGSNNKSTWDEIDTSYTTSKFEPTTYNYTQKLTIEHKDNIYTANIYPLVRKCMYDLDSDDFPQYIKYKNIPHDPQWFDVPARTLTRNTTLLRETCSDKAYSDCSNSDIMHNLVKQFNERHSNQKIFEVTQSYTPYVNNGKACDYAVKIARTVGLNGGLTKIYNNETIRFYLTETPITANPNSDKPKDKLLYKLQSCTYDLQSVDATKSNTGYSLNQSKTLGLLDTPYVWSVSLSKYITNTVNSAVQDYLGLDIVTKVYNVASNGFKKIYNLRSAVYTTQKFLDCSTNNKCDHTCKSDDVLRAMLNRYNFDNYPVYDLVSNPESNSVTQRKIIRVRRAGIALQKRCHLEVIEKIEFFEDFLYRAKNVNIQYMYRAFAIDIDGCGERPCTYKITKFTQNDIMYSTMDISGDPFGIQDNSTIITDSKWIDIDYENVYIPPNNEKVLTKVREAYNSNVIFKKPDNDLKKSRSQLIDYRNNIKNNDSFMKWFNARPNICEYKVKSSHVYWDCEYGIVYYTGEQGDMIPDETFIVAIWDEGTSYEVETGYYCKDLNGTGKFCRADASGAVVCTPRIIEIFFPDLTFTANGAITKSVPVDSSDLCNKNTKNENVILPYLANDGLLYSSEKNFDRKLYDCNPGNCKGTDNKFF